MIPAKNGVTGVSEYAPPSWQPPGGAAAGRMQTTPPVGEDTYAQISSLSKIRSPTIGSCAALSGATLVIAACAAWSAAASTARQTIRIATIRETIRREPTGVTLR